MDVDDRLVIRIPKQDKHALRRVAENMRTSVSAIVRKLIVDFLKDLKQ